MGNTEDFNLLAKLSALYTALTSSARGPVTVLSGLEPAERVSAFLGFFTIVLMTKIPL